MSIVLGIIIPAILYLITLPLQAFLFVLRQNLKAMEVASREQEAKIIKQKINIKSKY